MGVFGLEALVNFRRSRPNRLCAIRLLGDKQHQQQTAEYRADWPPQWWWKGEATEEDNSVIRCQLWRLLEVGRRNANAFSLYAIVQVRLRRRHEMIFNISETTKASNFKIKHNIALYSPYSFTGNEVTSCFRSAANRINVFTLGHVRVAISR